MGMNWLITGGCGFIGSSLINKLKLNGTNYIRVLDNLSVGSRNDLVSVTNFNEKTSTALTDNAGDVELLVGDILDEELVHKATIGIDTVVHLAANTGVAPSIENPRADMMINILGTFNVLEASRKSGVKRMIFASSGAPLGNVEPPIHEEMPPHPISPYGASKLSGEAYCSAYNKSYGLETVALRFGNVYGPRSGHKSSVVAKFIKHALEGKPLEIYGDGSQTRDFIFIDDLVKAILLSSSEAGIGGEIFQISSGSEITVGKLAENLIDILRVEGVQDIKLINSDNRIGDMKRNYSDTSKALTLLKWQKTTNLDDGLSKTVDYFLKNRELDNLAI